MADDEAARRAWTRSRASSRDKGGAIYVEGRLTRAELRGSSVSARFGAPAVTGTIWMIVGKRSGLAPRFGFR